MFRRQLLLFCTIWIFLPSVFGVKMNILRGEIESVDSEYAEADYNIRQENNENVVDVNFNFLKDLDNDTKIQVHVQLLKSDNELITIYESPLLDRCHFISNRELYPKLNAIYEQLEKYGNVLQNCPLLKGKYSVKGFKFSTDSIIGMLPPGNYVTHFLMTKEVDKIVRTIYSIKWFTEMVA